MDLTVFKISNKIRTVWHHYDKLYYYYHHNHNLATCLYNLLKIMDEIYQLSKTIEKELSKDKSILEFYEDVMFILVHLERDLPKMKVEKDVMEVFQMIKKAHESMIYWDHDTEIKIITDLTV